MVLKSFNFRSDQMAVTSENCRKSWTFFQRISRSSFSNIGDFEHNGKIRSHRPFWHLNLVMNHGNVISEKINPHSLGHYAYLS